MRRSFSVLSAFAALALASLTMTGCGAAEEAVDAREDELTSFPSQVLGSAPSIAYGQTLTGISFRASARWAAVKFQATSGDQIAANATPSLGKGLVYLARKQGNTFVNVPGDGPVASRIEATLGNGEYFLVFRTAPRRDATFSLSLAKVGGAAQGTFGQVIGQDPCLPGAGAAAAWVTQGRCNGRPGRSPIVSTQTGTLARSADVFASGQSYDAEGQAVFGNDGTIFLHRRAMMAVDPTTLGSKWQRDVGGVSVPSIGPSGSLYTFGSPMNGSFVGVDPTRGSTLWTTSSYNYKSGMTVLPDGKIFSVGYPSAYAVDPRGIDPRESYDSTERGDFVRLMPPVVSSTGMLYLRTAKGYNAEEPHLWAFDTTASPATRRATWMVKVGADRLALDEPAQRLYALRTEGGVTYVGSISAVDGQDAQWTQLGTPLKFGGSELALGTGGYVYFTDGDTLVGVDTVLHREWRASLGNAPTPAAGSRVPVVGGDGTVYVANQTGTAFHAYGFTREGAPRFDTTLPGAPEGTIAHAFVSIAPSGELVVYFQSGKKLYLLGP